LNITGDIDGMLKYFTATRTDINRTDITGNISGNSVIHLGGGPSQRDELGRRLAALLRRLREERQNNNSELT
jgi:hypothetical protein